MISKTPAMDHMSPAMPTGGAAVICWYAILQFTPINYFLLTSSQGFGYTYGRLVTTLLIAVAFATYLLCRTPAKPLTTYIYIAGIFFCGLTSCVVSQIRYGAIDVAMAAVYSEFFAHSVVLSLGARDFRLAQLFSKKKVIACFLLLNIFLWFVDAASGKSYGVFRAYISGVTLNRLPDFFWPVLTATALFVSRSSALKMIFIFYAALTLYRTIYLAVLLSALVGFNRRIFSLRSLLMGAGLLACAAVAFSYIQIDPTLLFERFMSLFTSESKVAGEASKSQRVQDFWILASYLNGCFPFGCAASPSISQPLYNFPAFQLWSLAGFGIFGLPLILFTLLIPLKIVRQGLRANKADASIFIAVSIILLFFPYVHYFPLMFYVAYLNRRSF